MNKRLKELAERAETKEIGYYFFDREKFAELIVQDCIRALLEWKREPFPFEPDDAARLLREHFGVEE